MTEISAWPVMPCHLTRRVLHLFRWEASIYCIFTDVFGGGEETTPTTHYQARLSLKPLANSQILVRTNPTSQFHRYSRPLLVQHCMKTSPAMSTLPSSGDHHGLRTTKLDVSVSLRLAQSIIALGKLTPETNSGEVPATVSSMAAPKLSIGLTIAPLHRRVNVLKLGPNPNRFEAMFREAEDFDELRLNMRHPETRKRLM
jgi:hypothetical protein